MTKYIIVETPLDCPYQSTLKNSDGVITRRWCTYSGYDECYVYRFPKDCPLDDMPKAYDPD